MADERNNEKKAFIIIKLIKSLIMPKYPQIKRITKISYFMSDIKSGFIFRVVLDVNGDLDHTTTLNIEKEISNLFKMSGFDLPYGIDNKRKDRIITYLHNYSDEE